MKAIVILIGLIGLASCQSLGRYPGQSDVSCVRSQMAGPAYYTANAAISRCQQFYESYGGHYAPIPFDFRSAPDLEQVAEANGWVIVRTSADEQVRQRDLLALRM